MYKQVAKTFINKEGKQMTQKELEELLEKL